MVKIFLDTGHYFYSGGEKRPGAGAFGVQEEMYNLNIRNKVKEIYNTRVSIDNMLAMLPKVFKVLVTTHLYRPASYYLVLSNENPEVLCGTYQERLIAAKELGIDAHIQMHLNAAGGKYSLVGYNSDNREHREKSEELANIAAEIMNENFDPNNDGSLISNIKVVPCSDYSDGDMERNIAYCLRHSPCPAVLMEPLFLDNETHANFLKSEEGEEAMVRIYTQMLEKFSEVLS